MAETVTTALVTATYGRQIDLRMGEDNSVRARVKGRRLQPVCGDQVIARPLPNETDWLVDAIVPRRNQLTRPDRQGRAEILAANVDLVGIVAAALPAPDWFVVDRYLCAAELMSAEAAVLFNKIDLGDASEAAAAALGEYEALGYPALRISARDVTRLGPLRQLLRARTAVIVGQSGVGKSSIINGLCGDDALPTGAVSRKRREGKHTTVVSRMRRLADGGQVIDSPGVRDYAPAIDAPADVMRGFREILAAAPACRFADCAHLREPGCAVAEGVAAGAISARRYESYRRLLRSSEKLRQKFSNRRDIR